MLSPEPKWDELSRAGLVNWFAMISVILSIFSCDHPMIVVIRCDRSCPRVRGTSENIMLLPSAAAWLRMTLEIEIIRAKIDILQMHMKMFVRDLTHCHRHRLWLLKGHKPAFESGVPGGSWYWYCLAAYCLAVCYQLSAEEHLVAVTGFDGGRPEFHAQLYGLNPNRLWRCSHKLYFIVFPLR